MAKEQNLESLRAVFGDWVGDTTDALYDNTARNRWINFAQRNMCENYLILRKTFTILSRANDAFYSFSAPPINNRLFLPTTINYDSHRELFWITEKELDEQDYLWRNKPASSPYFAYMKDASTVGLFFKPDTDGQNIDIEGWCIPEKDMVEDTDFPEIPVFLHDALGIYAAKFALQIDVSADEQKDRIKYINEALAPYLKTLQRVKTGQVNLQRGYGSYQGSGMIPVRPSVIFK